MVLVSAGNCFDAKTWGHTNCRFRLGWALSTCCSPGHVSSNDPAAKQGRQRCVLPMAENARHPEKGHVEAGWCTVSAVPTSSTGRRWSGWWPTFGGFWAKRRARRWSSARALARSRSRRLSTWGASPQPRMVSGGGDNYLRRSSRVSRDWPVNRVPRHRRTAFGRAGVGTYVAEIVLDLAHRGDVGRVDRDNPGAHRDTVAGDGKRDDGLRIVVSPIIGMPALAQGSNVSPCHWWLATSVCRSRTRPWWRHRTPDRHRARADRRCSRRPPVRSNCRNRRQDRERWLGKSAQYAESPFEKFCLSVNGLRDA